MKINNMQSNDYCNKLPFGMIKVTEPCKSNLNKIADAEQIKKFLECETWKIPLRNVVYSINPKNMEKIKKKIDELPQNEVDDLTVEITDIGYKTENIGRCMGESVYKWVDWLKYSIPALNLEGTLRSRDYDQRCDFGYIRRNFPNRFDVETGLVNAIRAHFGIH